MTTIDDKSRNMDHEAMNAFCRENGAGLVRFLLAQGVRRDDVEDVAQDCLVTLWSKRDKVRDGEFRPYLFGIAKLKACNWRRKNDRERSRMDASSRPESWDAIAASQYALDPDGGEALMRLREAVERLSPRLRDVVRLLYFEDVSHKEAARRLGVTENTIRQHEWNARKHLRKLVGLIEQSGKSTSNIS